MPWPKWTREQCGTIKRGPRGGAIRWDSPRARGPPGVSNIANSAGGALEGSCERTSPTAAQVVVPQQAPLAAVSSAASFCSAFPRCAGARVTSSWRTPASGTRLPPSDAESSRGDVGTNASRPHARKLPSLARRPSPRSGSRLAPLLSQALGSAATGVMGRASRGSVDEVAASGGRGCLACAASSGAIHAWQ